ncbi:SDR family oxidoreductase [Halobacillus fulvus]|nr:SDR family oxidoreductase [Halobacillus fulvus]
MKPIVVITGSSSGFGHLTALKCAEKGFQVIATMRNPEKAAVFKEVSPESRGNIDVWTLDVTNQTSVNEFEEKLKELGRIDILVNNAGFAMGGFVEQLPVSFYQKQMETNFFGAIRVTQAVLPIMRNQGRGKILNVSSISGRIGFPGLSAYVSSKFALEGWSESLRLEMKPFGIDVALLEPGSFQTNIWTSGMELPEGFDDPDSPYASYSQGIWKALNQETHGNPSHMVTQMVKLMNKQELYKLRYPVGKSVRSTLFMKTILPWKVLENIILKTILPKSFSHQPKKGTVRAQRRRNNHES